jgi:hypothetical protein
LFINGLPDWLEKEEIFEEGNRMKIINVKNTVKFPLFVFLIVLPETALYIVHPLYNPPWILSPKIGPDLWIITRFECIRDYENQNELKFYRSVL